MAEYRLSVRARAQLIDIYDFTSTTFGQYQVEAYHAGLERTFGLLADFPRIGQSVEEWRRATAAFDSSPTVSSTRKKRDIS